MKESKRLIFIETVLIIAMVIALLTLPYLAFKTNKFEDGDHFANMISPLLSLVGSILVYVAFKAQIRANDKIQMQFDKQNFDQNFFRLIDNIEKRITNSEIEHLVGDKKEKGYSILSYIVEEINKKHDTNNSIFGRWILLVSPESLDDKMWQRLFNEIDGNKYKNWEEVKAAFINGDKNKREEILTHDVVYNEYNSEYDNFINDIFNKYFYLQSEEFYNTYYRYITNEMFSNYIVFFDGYNKSIAMMLKHIESIKDNHFYVDYLVDNLTTYEKIIIWLAVATKKYGSESRKRILKFKILEDLNGVNGIKPLANPKYYEHIIERLKS